MLVKICGLTDAATVAAAAEAGARYVGFVFFAKSPRNIDFDAARTLAAETPPGVMKVALVVNPDDALIDQVAAAPIDMIQLHGSETPERVGEVKARSGLPVMKAVGIAGAEDVSRIDAYAEVADQLLIDAKPPKTGELPGGNGVSFDWRLIANRDWTVPWMLAGGLTPENVREAIRLTGARQIDVSSGVESGPGVKDAALIRAFCAAALENAG
ncbi:MAG: phosphoribosylanthranilate isomerase [Pseudomonadota bacterium]